MTETLHSDASSFAQLVSCQHPMSHVARSMCVREHLCETTGCEPCLWAFWADWFDVVCDPCEAAGVRESTRLVDVRALS